MITNLPTQRKGMLPVKCEWQLIPDNNATFRATAVRDQPACIAIFFRTKDFYWYNEFAYHERPLTQTTVIPLIGNLGGSLI